MFILLPALFENGLFCQGKNFAKWISVNITSCLFAQVEHERWETLKWKDNKRSKADQYEIKCEEWPRYVSHMLQPFSGRLALENPPMDLPRCQTSGISLQQSLRPSRLDSGDFEWDSPTAVSQICYVRLERGEWGLTGSSQSFVRAEQGPSGTRVSVSVPERDAEGAAFPSEGLPASSHFMRLCETVRATKAWTTSVRSSSFSLLLARK